MLLIKRPLFKILQTVDNPIAKKIVKHGFIVGNTDIVITGIENADIIFKYLTPAVFDTILTNISKTINCFDLSSEAGLITFVRDSNLKSLIDNVVSEHQKQTCNDESVFFILFNANLIKSKPARVFRKVYNELFTEAEYADFGDKMNSAILAYVASTSGIKIVSGDDIYWAYNEHNYYDEHGELASSCMRYSHCKNYLDLYVDNSDVVRLIVAIKNNLVIGRCLLWNNKYYDRIYFNNEATRQNIIKYCEENGFISIYGSVIHESIQLTTWEYSHYPYMDTFCYLSNTGILYNKKHTNKVLKNTDGEYDEYILCPYCRQKQWVDGLYIDRYCTDCFRWDMATQNFVLR